MTTALEVIGGALIVAGTAFILWPAALVVAGAFFLLASYRIETS
jgi:hypothetical protein